MGTDWEAVERDWLRFIGFLDGLVAAHGFHAAVSITDAYGRIAKAIKGAAATQRGRDRGGACNGD